MEGQHDDGVRVEMRALSDEAVMGEVHLSTEAQPATGDPMTMAQPVEVQFDVRGLEPNQEVALLVHRGACSVGTTTIAELGRFTADGTGQLMQTETVRNEELSTIMADEARKMEHERMMDDARRDTTAMWYSTQARDTTRVSDTTRGNAWSGADSASQQEDTYHLQLEANGQPLACGNFGSAEGAYGSN